MKTKNRNSKTRFHDAFRVEPLEPRVLLSADPIVTPLALALLPHHQQAPSDIHTAVMALGTHDTTTQPLVHSAYVTQPVAAAPASTPVAPAANAQPYVDAGTLAAHTDVLNTAVTLRNMAHIQAVTTPGSLTQTPTSNLAINLGGTTPGAYDQINVTGLAALAGAMTVTVQNGFTPTNGEAFTVLTYGSVQGSFSAVNGLLDLKDGLYFQVTQGATSLTLTAHSLTPALNAALSQLPVALQNPAGEWLSSSAGGTQQVSAYFPSISGSFTLGNTLAVSGTLTFGFTQLNNVTDPTSGANTTLDALTLSLSNGSAFLGTGSSGITLSNVTLDMAFVAVQPVALVAPTYGWIMSHGVVGSASLSAGGVLNVTSSNLQLTVDLDVGTVNGAANNSVLSLGSQTFQVGASSFTGTGTAGTNVVFTGSGSVSGALGGFSIGANVSVSDVNGSLSLIGSGANLTAGNSEASFGISNGSFGLLSNAGGLAFQASGAVALAGAGLGTVSAQSVTFVYNNTSTDLTGTAISLNGSTYTFAAAPAGADYVAVNALNVALGPLHFSGNFSVGANGDGTWSVIALNGAASVSEGAFSVSLSSVSLAVDYTATGYALQAGGGFTAALGSVISLSAASAMLSVNTTGTDFSNHVLTAGPLSYTFGANLVAGRQEVSASGAVLTLGSFFQATGSVDVQWGTATLTLAGGATKAVNDFLIGGVGLGAQVGTGVGTAAFAGLAATSADFALGAFSATSGPGSWTSLSATVSSITTVGLRGITLSAANVAVAYNAASAGQAVANTLAHSFAIVVPTGIATSSTVTLAIDGSLGTLFQASGLLTLVVDGVAQLTGNFDITSTTGQTVSLSDGSTATVNELTIGGNAVSLFVGVGNTGTAASVSAGAVGLSLTGVNFGAAFLTGTGARTGQSWTTAESHGGTLSLAGIPDTTLVLRNIEVEYNKAASGNATTAVVNYAGSTGGNSNALNVATGTGTAPVALDIDGALGNFTLVSGNLDLDVDSAVQVSGDFALSTLTGQQVTLSDGTVKTVDEFTIGAAGASLFAGVGNAGGTAASPAAGATGLSVTGVNFGVAFLKDATGDKWISAESSGGSASLLGIPDVTVTATNIVVDVNKNSLGGSNPVIDFGTNHLSVATGAAPVVIDIAGSHHNYALVQADLDIELGTAVELTGSFALQSQTGQSVTLSDTSVASVDELTLGGANVNVFVGVHNAGGSAATPAAGAIGLSVTGVDFGLAFLKGTGTSAGQSWVSAESTGGTAQVLGIPDVLFVASNIVVDYNHSADGSSAVVDYTATTLAVPTGGSAVTLDMDGANGNYDLVTATLDFALQSVVQIHGNFAVSAKTGQTVSLSDGSSATVDEFTVGGADDNVFVGVGNSGGNAQVLASGAAGLHVTHLDFGVAFLTGTGTSAGKGWTSAESHGGTAALVGVTGISASAANILIDVNKSSSGTGPVVNYAGANAQGDLNTIDIPTGDATDPSVTLDINGNNGQYTLVQAKLDFSLDGDVSIEGNFAFSSKTGQTVTLSNNTTATVDEVTIGGAGISAFAGYNNTANEIPGASSGSVGLLITGLDFGIAFLKGATASWTSAESHNGTAQLIGVPNLTVVASNIEVQYNHNAAGSGFVVDYAGTGHALSVPTGATPVTLDMAGSHGNYTLVASTLDFSLGNLFEVTGDFAVSSQTGQHVTLNDTSVATVNEFTLGGTNVSIFAGYGNAGGTAASPAAGAIGLSITGVNFGLAILTATDVAHSGIKWTSAESNGGAAQFLGIPGVTIAATNVVAAYNATSSTAHPNLVVDYLGAHALSVPTGQTSTLTLDMDGSKNSYKLVSAHLVFDLFDVAEVDGNFAISSSLAQHVTLSDTSTAIVNELTIGGEGVHVYAGGPDGNSGFDASGVDFGLAFLTGTGLTAGKSWTAAESHGGTVTLKGLPTGFQFTVSDIHVQVNTTGTGAGAVVDWSANNLSVPTGGTADVLDIDGSLGVYKLAEAHVDLDLDGFITVHGDFGVSTSTHQTVHLSNGTSTTVNIMTLGGSDISAFVGDGIDNIGVSVTDLNFGLAVMTSTVDASLVWTAAESTSGNAAVVGITAITLSVQDLQVRYNHASSGTAVVDFAGTTAGVPNTLSVPTGGAPLVFDMSGSLGILSEVAADATLRVSQFFYLSGEFDITESQMDSVTLSNGLSVGSSATKVNVVSFGVENVNAFIGTGYNADTTLAPTFDDAIAQATGFAATGVQVAVSVLTFGGQHWTTVQSSGGQVGLVGLSSDYALSVGAFTFNGNFAAANGTAIDYSAGHTQLAVTTGFTNGVADTVTYSMDGVAIDASLTGTLIAIDGFVYLSGDFTVAEVSNLHIDTVSSTSAPAPGTLTMNALEFTGANVYAFFGVGGPTASFTTGGALGDGAIGLFAQNIDFNLAVLSQASNGTAGNTSRGPTFVTMDATATNISLVGMGTFLTFSMHDLTLAVNASTTTVFADYHTHALVIGSDSIGFNGQTLEVSSSWAVIGINVGSTEVVGIAGGFGITVETLKGIDFNVPGIDIVSSAQALVITGTNVNAFIGYNPGVDWSSLAHFNAKPTGDGAVGFSVQGLNFAFALMSPAGAFKLPSMKFFSLEASASLIGLVGTDPYLTLQANSIHLDFNGAEMNGYLLPGVFINYLVTDNASGVKVARPGGLTFNGQTLAFSSNTFGFGLDATLGIFDLFTLTLPTIDFDLTLPTVSFGIPSFASLFSLPSLPSIPSLTFTFPDLTLPAIPNFNWNAWALSFGLPSINLHAPSLNFDAINALKNLFAGFAVNFPTIALPKLPDLSEFFTLLNPLRNFTMPSLSLGSIDLSALEGLYAAIRQLSVDFPDITMPSLPSLPGFDLSGLHLNLPDPGILFSIDLSQLFDFAHDLHLTLPDWLSGFMQDFKLSIELPDNFIPKIFGSISIPNLSFNLGGFVYVSGNFDLELGASFVADMYTGLPPGASSLLDTILHAIPEVSAIASSIEGLFGPLDVSHLPDVTFNGLTFTGTDVNMFIGVAINGATPDLSPTALPLSQQDGGRLFGFAMTGVELGIGVFKAHLPFGIKTSDFYTITAHAETVQAVGLGFISVVATNVTLDVNFGGDFYGNKALLTTADYTTISGGLGLQLKTSDGTLLYLTDTGPTFYKLDIGFADIQVSQFLDLQGSLEFTDGTVLSGVVVDTGLLATGLGLPSTYTTHLTTMTFAGSHLEGFFGVGGPYKVWDAATQSYDIANAAATGLVISDVNFAMVVGVPTDLAFLMQSVGLPAGEAGEFITATATVGAAHLVGINPNILTLSAYGVTLDINTFYMPALSGPLNAALLVAGPPYIDWLTSFPISSSDPLGGYGVPAGGGNLVYVRDHTAIIQAGISFAELNLGGVLQIMASLEITYESPLSFQTTNSDSAHNIVSTSALMFGLTNGYAFEGVGGPYWIPNDPVAPTSFATNPNSVGIALNNLSAGILVATQVTPSFTMPTNLAPGDVAEITGSVTVGVYVAASIKLASVSLVGVPPAIAVATFTNLEFDLNFGTQVSVSGTIGVDSEGNISVESVSGTATFYAIDFTQTPATSTTRPGEFDIPAGGSNYFPLKFSQTELLIKGTGELDLINPGSGYLMVVQATVFLEVDPTEFVFAFSGTATIQGGTISQVTVLDGLVDITSAGVAADLHVRIGTYDTTTSHWNGATVGGTGGLAKLGGNFELTLNTTSTAVSVTVPTPTYVNGVVTGTGTSVGDTGIVISNGSTTYTVSATPSSQPGWTGAYIEFAATAEFYITNYSLIDLNGQIDLLLSASGFSMDFTGTAELGGSSLLSLSAAGQLTLSSAGIYGDLALHGNLGSFITGSFLLEMNSTSIAHDVKGLSADGSPGTISVGAGVYEMAGSVTIGAAGISVIGTMFIEIQTAGAFELDGEIGIHLGLGSIGSLDGAAFIHVTSSSFALAASLAANFSIAGGAIGITATAKLGINTGADFTVPSGVPGLPVAFPASIAGMDLPVGSGSSPYFDVALSGTINLFVFHATLAAEIKYSSNVFSLDVTQASISFFGIANVNITGHIDSLGNVSLNGSFDFGIDAFIVLDFGFDIGFSYHAGGSFSVSADVHITVGVDLGIFGTYTYTGSVYATISTDSITIGTSIAGFDISETWSWGSKPVFGYKVGNVLYLALGQGTGGNPGYGSSTVSGLDESVYVDYTAGTDTLKVSEFGADAQTWTGITEIDTYAPTSGTGKQSLLLSQNVTQNLVYNGGNRNSTVTIYGSGVHNYTLNLGTGSNTINYYGAGHLTVNVGAAGGHGTNTLYADTYDLPNFVATGDHPAGEATGTITFNDNGTLANTIYGGSGAGVYDFGNSANALYLTSSNNQIEVEAGGQTSVLWGPAQFTHGTDSHLPGMPAANSGSNIITLEGLSTTAGSAIGYLNDALSYQVGDPAHVPLSFLTFDDSIAKVVVLDAAAATRIVSSGNVSWGDVDLDLTADGTLDASGAAFKSTTGRLSIQANGIIGPIGGSVGEVSIVNNDTHGDNNANIVASFATTTLTDGSGGLTVVGDGLYATSGTVFLSVTGADTSATQPVALTLAGGSIYAGGTLAGVTIVANDIDFKSGAGQVQGSGALVIKATDLTQNYTIGTSADVSGGDLSGTGPGAGALNLGTRDLAALSAGFTSITIGQNLPTLPAITMNIGNVASAGSPLLLPFVFDAGTINVTGTITSTSATLFNAASMTVSGTVAADTIVVRASQLVTVSGTGRLTGADGIDVAVSGSTGTNSVVLATGSILTTSQPDSRISILGSAGVSDDGHITSTADGVSIYLAAGTALSLGANARVIDSQDNVFVTLSAVNSVSLASGSQVLAGVHLDVNGDPVISGPSSVIAIESGGTSQLNGLLLAGAGIQNSTGISQTTYANFYIGGLATTPTTAQLALLASQGIIIGTPQTVTAPAAYIPYDSLTLAQQQEIQILLGMPAQTFLAGSPANFAPSGNQVYFYIDASKLNGTASTADLALLASQGVLVGTVNTVTPPTSYAAWASLSSTQQARLTTLLGLAGVDATGGTAAVYTIAGELVVGEAINAQGRNVTLRGSQISIKATLSSVGGLLTIVPVDTTAPVILGVAPGTSTAAGALVLDTTTLGNIGNGWAGIVVGGPSMRNEIDVGAQGAGATVTIHNNLYLEAPQLGGEIFIYQPLTLDNQSTLTIVGPGQTTTAAADVTADASVVVSDSVALAASNVRITAGGAAQASAGNVTLGTSGDYVYGTTAGDSLTVLSTRNVTFGGNVDASPVDSGFALKNLTIGSAANKVVNVEFQGTVNLTGNLTIYATGSVTFDKGVTITGGGTLTIVGAATTVVGKTLTLSGTSAGVAGNIAIQSDQLVFGGGHQSVSGHGTLTVTPTTAGRAIDIADPVGVTSINTLNFSDTDIAALDGNFASLVFGASNGVLATVGDGAVLVGGTYNGGLAGAPTFQSAVTIYGDSITVQTYGSTVATANYTFYVDGNITLDAVHDIALNNAVIADAGNGNIAMTSASGAITQQAGGNAVVQASDLYLSALTGITLPAIQAVTLTATNAGTTGNIAIVQDAAGGDLSLLGVQQANASAAGNIAVATTQGNLSVAAGGTGVATAGSGNVSLGASAALTVSRAVGTHAGSITLASGGLLDVEAQVASTGGAVSLTSSTGAVATNALIRSAGGALALTAAADVTLGANVQSGGGALSVESTGGSIHVATDVATAGGHLTLTADAGDIVMLAGQTLSALNGANSGQIDLLANGSVSLATLAAGGSVSVTARTGAIVDVQPSAATLNIDGATASLLLSAATGIGSSARNIEIGVSELTLSNSVSGDVYVTQARTGTLHLGTGAANVDAVTLGGSTGMTQVMTDDGAIVVDGRIRSTATSGGNIELGTVHASSGVIADIRVNADISSTSGSILLSSADAIVLGDVAGTHPATISAAGALQTVSLQASAALVFARLRPHHQLQPRGRGRPRPRADERRRRVGGARQRRQEHVHGVAGFVEAARADGLCRHLVRHHPALRSADPGAQGVAVPDAPGVGRLHRRSGREAGTGGRVVRPRRRRPDPHRDQPASRPAGRGAGPSGPGGSQDHRFLHLRHLNDPRFQGPRHEFDLHATPRARARNAFLPRRARARRGPTMADQADPHGGAGAAGRHLGPDRAAARRAVADQPRARRGGGEPTGRRRRGGRAGGAGLGRRRLYLDGRAIERVVGHPADRQEALRPAEGVHLCRRSERHGPRAGGQRRVSTEHRQGGARLRQAPPALGERRQPQRRHAVQPARRDPQGEERHRHAGRPVQGLGTGDDRPAGQPGADDFRGREQCRAFHQERQAEGAGGGLGDAVAAPARRADLRRAGDAGFRAAACECRRRGPERDPQAGGRPHPQRSGQGGPHAEVPGGADRARAGVPGRGVGRPVAAGAGDDRRV